MPHLAPGRQPRMPHLTPLYILYLRQSQYNRVHHHNNLRDLPRASFYRETNFPRYIATFSFYRYKNYRRVLPKPIDLTTVVGSY
jgi:hypothetical protein